MKKSVYLLAPALLAAFAVSAQPTLTNNVFPEIGDQFSTIEGTTNISEGNAGANQTWNFTALEPASDTTVATSGVVVAAAGTPYAAMFPQANLALRTDDTTYTYLQTTSSLLTLHGLASPVLIIPYTNPQNLLQVPLNFNGSFSDTYAYSFSFEFEGLPLTVYSTGSRTSTYDAYGTLNAPAGNFTNAMRVRTVESQRDSAGVFGIGYTITQNTTTSYDYYVANRPGAQVTISYTDGFSYTVFPGVPTDTSFIETIKSVNYVLPGTSSVDETPAQRFGLEIASVAPNPTTDELTVRFTAATAKTDLRLLVTDNLGRTVATQELPATGNGGMTRVAVSHLATGAYTLTLTDGKVMQSVRFQKL